MSKAKIFGLFPYISLIVYSIGFVIIFITIIYDMATQTVTNSFFEIGILMMVVGSAGWYPFMRLKYNSMPDYESNFERCDKE